VTDADVSDKEQGNENEIGSDEPQENVARRFQEKWLSVSASVLIFLKKKKFFLPGQTKKL
jgi:hypothetical protein